MDTSREKEIDALCEENARRNEEMFRPYDPLTGEGCYGARVAIEIPDFILPKMYVPGLMVNNFLVHTLLHYGSIKLFIKDYWHKDVTEERKMLVAEALLRLRFRYDPEFAFFAIDRIEDKQTGKLVPFRLNNPQRRLLSVFEDMRLAGKPIQVVLAKARQWGGSTLSQLYIKWMQDFICPDGWNAIVLAQVKGTAKKIKGMYRRALENQAGWTIGHPGKRLHFSPYENSQDDFIITTADGQAVRQSLLTVASYENYDNVRGGNYHMAHYSEVAYWRQTAERDPQGVVASISGGFTNIANEVEIFESSARGSTGFFYKLYMEAKNGSSSPYQAIFVPFYEIENDRLPVADQKSFAAWLIENRDRDVCPEGFRESGRFFWRVWTMGATFEAIHWYRTMRNRYGDHAYMASEAPIDDVEAFSTSDNLIFNPYSIDAMAETFNRLPRYGASINLIGLPSTSMITSSNISIHEYVGGDGLKIWALPNNSLLRVRNRYIVAVDIGGTRPESDYTVMTCIDRLGLISEIHSLPQVVARWRGHIRHDRLAWTAAVLAHYYDDALLVIESNTADSEKGTNADGDHSGSVLDEIARYYPNLYKRGTKPDNINGTRTRWGFQTNKLSKTWIIDNLIAYVDDMLWDEPDEEMYKELRIYERKDDGSMGNIEGRGNHDDVLMSTAIALWISDKDMARPSWIKEKKELRNNMEAMTEATI